MHEAVCRWHIIVLALFFIELEARFSGTSLFTKIFLIRNPDKVIYGGLQAHYLKTDDEFQSETQKRKLNC